jgi:two-component system, cell cycle sensor histidine kinase PleC
MTLLARAKGTQGEAAGPDVLAEQVRLLYAGAFVIPANLLNAGVVALALRHSYPGRILILWVCLTAAVVAGRMVLVLCYRWSATADSKARRWARRFAAGALLSGALWGAVCATLPFFGQPLDFLFVTLVAAAMSAAAMTSLSAYFPAYLCYLLPFIVPTGVAFLLTRGPDHSLLGALTLIYAVILAGTGYNLHRSIIRTLQLKTANAQLNKALSSTLAELDLARQDKWRSFAHLSHELRTPLTAILGFSEAIRDQLLGPLGNPRYGDYARHVHSSGQHLLNLASEILAFSQGEAGALPLSESEIDVAAIIEQCVDLVAARAEQQRLRIVCRLQPGLPRLFADETKLWQILLNLLTNAIKFTLPEGEITIVASLAKDGGITISVADTGVGMASSDIPRALAPFVRLENALVQETEGVGLGLPLCKRLAELHGAELMVASEPGTGTTCTLRFPPSRTCAGAPPDRVQRSGGL